MESSGYYGWTLTSLPIRCLKKTFTFNTKQNLSNFIVGLLFIEHEPSDPVLEATEKYIELKVDVSIDIDSSKLHLNRANIIVVKIEKLFESI